jgi:hypothetical protein
MSFALQYRKKLQQQQSEALAVKKANEGFVSMPADASTDTSTNRRRVFLALILAGGILAVFNSGGLVNYTQGFANNPVGPHLILASERWHELMQKKQATRVVEHFRGSIALVREASWRDLAFGLQLTTAEKPDDSQPLPKVVPAKMTPVPGRQQPVEPRIARPAGPVLRASVERRP